MFLPPPANVKPELVRPYEAFSVAGAQSSDVQPDLGKWSFKTRPIPYAVLIWKVAGKDVAMAIRPSVEGQTFEGFLNLAKNALECSAEDLVLKGDDCGNIEFHAYVYNSQLSQKPAVHYDAGHVRTHSMKYTLGTPDQLRSLGFKIPQQ